MLNDLDIYTLKPMCSPSNEHVIHNFLGGTLTGLLIDTDVNSQFGSTIDRELHALLHPFLLLLDLPSGSGTSPKPKSKIAKDSEGRDWKLLPGGDLECETVRQHATVSVTDDKRIRIDFAAEGGASLTKERAAENLTKRVLRHPEMQGFLQERGQEGLETISQMIAASVNAEFATSCADVAWGTNMRLTHGALRAIVKIACNLFSIHNRAAFCRSGFDVARRFVFAGEGAPPLQLCYPPPLATGQICHAAAYDVQDDGSVVGLVTIFGHMCFRIKIGHVDSDISPVVKRHLYIVDQPGQRCHSGIPEESLGSYNEALSFDESFLMYRTVQRSNFIFALEVASLIRKIATLDPEIEKSERDRVIEQGTQSLVASLFRNGVLKVRTPRDEQED